MKKNYWGCLIFILLIVFGFLIPMMTNGEHFSCDSNGNCSYYDLIHYFKTNKTFFNINSNTNISCVQTPNRPERYHLVITTNGVNTEISSYYSANRCNIHKTALENNLSKSDKTFKYKNTIPINIAIKIFIFSILVGFLGVFEPILAIKEFSKPQNINKPIINPWFNIFLLWLFAALCLFINITQNNKYEILVYCGLLFACIPFAIIFSTLGKGVNFRDNYSETYPQNSGFADSLVTWSKLSTGAMYFTENEIVLVQALPKYMDIVTEVININDIKNLKKSKFSNTIFIYTSNKKYKIDPIGKINANEFLTLIVETIEKIKNKVR